MPDLAFRRMVLILTGAGLIGALTGTVVSMNIPARFVSTALVRIFRTQSMRSLKEYAMSRRSLADIIQRENLYGVERQQMPMEDVLIRMRSDISVQSVNNADVYKVSVEYPDAAKAQQANRALLARMAERGLTVIRPPTMPDRNQGLTRAEVTGISISGSVLLVSLIIGLWHSSQVRKVTLAAVAGGLVGMVISLLIPAKYTSTSRLAVIDLMPVDRVTASSYFAEVSKRGLDSALARIALRNQLSVSALRKRIVIAPDGADEFLVSATAGSAATAQSIAANVITGLTETPYTMQLETEPDDQAQRSFWTATAMSEVGGRTPTGRLKPNISGMDVGLLTLEDPRARSAVFLLRNYASGGPLKGSQFGQERPNQLHVPGPLGGNGAIGPWKNPGPDAAARLRPRLLEVVESASLPERPTTSHTLFVTLAGGAAGLLLTLSPSLRRALQRIESSGAV